MIESGQIKPIFQQASNESSSVTDIMERSADRGYLYQRVAIQPTPSDSKNSIVDDYEYYKQYYSTERLPFHLSFQFGRFRMLLAAIVTFILLGLIFNRNSRNSATGDLFPPEASVFLPHTPTKTLGGTLSCGSDAMKPSPTVPEDVNKVRPADIKIIGAMGDSIMVGAYSTNFLDDTSDLYPGNSFAIGGDESLKTHITLANVLREFNPNLVGMSHGDGYERAEFNVAISGWSSFGVPKQAHELVQRITAKEEISVHNDWKLITIFIGTNDIRKLRCYSKREPTSREQYKANIEEAISILRANLNRTIISIVSIWNSQLVYDAASLIDTGKRMECGDDYITKRDALTEEYRKVAYEIQNEKKFDDPDFTVVVQGFMDDIRDAFRNKQGDYDKSFYGADVFHLSKYGNAVLGKFLWNALLEPVGKKTTKPDLGDDSVPLKCPTKDSPFIQTLGNRKSGDVVTNGSA